MNRMCAITMVLLVIIAYMKFNGMMVAKRIYKSLMVIWPLGIFAKYRDDSFHSYSLPPRSIYFYIPCACAISFTKQTKFAFFQLVHALSLNSIHIISIGIYWPIK